MSGAAVAAAGQELWAVILAGGQGTRFWPLSRADRPKQFLCIDGRQTLLQATVERFLRFIPAVRVLVVTGDRFVDETRTSLPSLPAANILAEPEGRDTLAAAILATVAVTRRAATPEAVMVVAPCDHAVSGAVGFRRTLEEAAACAAAGDCLVTIGVRPERPETGYGYILPGQPASRPGTARRVVSFVEKPDAPRAAKLIAAGCLWNTGVFTWQADAFLGEVTRRCGPGAAHSIDSIDAIMRDGAPSDAATLLPAYRCLPRISIDRALLEQGTAAAVVTARFAWEDLGSWGAVWRRGTPDADGNVLAGPVQVVDGRNNLVWSSSRHVVVAGLSGLVIVATDNVILVTAKQRDQEIKTLTQQLADSPLRHCL